MKKNKTEKIEQKLLQNETTLSPQSQMQTVETYNYPKKNINTILELLNKLEVKGRENIFTIASIFQVLESPIDEGVSEIKTNEM